MYFRKCWRDNRAQFMVHLGLFVGVALAISLANIARYSNETGWSLVLPETPEGAAYLWRSASRVLLPSVLMLGLLTGVGMGATGVAGEFQTGTFEFLLTRPRSRRHFNWTGWASGMAQILTMGAAAMLAAFASLAAFSGTVETWRLWTIVPVALTGGGITFGLAYLLSVILRDARQGQGFALIAVVLWPFLVFAANYYWQIRIPTPWDLMPGRPGGDPAGDLYTTVAFPWRSFLGWTLFSLAMPFTAQLVFERAEL